MMLIQEKFSIGDKVYLKTDMNQFTHIVTGITIRAGLLEYKLSCDKDETTHFELEISHEKNILVNE